MARWSNMACNHSDSWNVDHVRARETCVWAGNTRGTVPLYKGNNTTRNKLHAIDSGRILKFSQMAWNLGSKIRKRCPLRKCINMEHQNFDHRGNFRIYACVEGGGGGGINVGSCRVKSCQWYGPMSMSGNWVHSLVAIALDFDLPWRKCRCLV